MEGDDMDGEQTMVPADGEVEDAEPFSMIEAAEEPGSLWEVMVERLPDAEDTIR
jgi:hypothetical protein